MDRGMAAAQIARPRPKAVARHPWTTMAQASTGTSSPPRLLPVMATAIAVVLKRRNQLLMAVIRGRNPPRPLPIKTRAKAAKNRGRPLVKLRATNPAPRRARPMITMRRVPSLSVR